MATTVVPFSDAESDWGRTPPQSPMPSSSSAVRPDDVARSVQKVREYREILTSLMGAEPDDTTHGNAIAQFLNMGKITDLFALPPKTVLQSAERKYGVFMRRLDNTAKCVDPQGTDVLETIESLKKDVRDSYENLRRMFGSSSSSSGNSDAPTTPSTSETEHAARRSERLQRKRLRKGKSRVVSRSSESESGLGSSSDSNSEEDIMNESSDSDSLRRRRTLRASRHHRRHRRDSCSSSSERESGPLRPMPEVLAVEEELNKREEQARKMLPINYKSRSYTDYLNDEETGLGGKEPAGIAVINFVLGVLQKFDAKRSHDWVCLKKETPDKHNTRFYHRYMKISEFIETHCTFKNVAGDMWANMLRPGVKSQAVKFLSTARNEKEFLEYNVCRSVFAFDKGIYVTQHLKAGNFEAEPNDFYRYDGPKINQLPTVFGSANYIPGEVDFDWLATDDPMDVPTPVTDSILDHQGWSDEIKFIFFAVCVGRVCFALGTYDNWQIAPFFYGVAGTGKSTLLKIISKIYPPERVYTMSNDTQGQFSIANAEDKNVVIITEVKANFALPQSQFQSMVAAESMECSRKHIQETIQANPWNVPLLMAGNEVMNYGDQAESIARRLLIFVFSELVTRVDANMDKKLEEELPALLIKGVRCYHKLAALTHGSNLWDARYKRKPEEVEAQEEAFISSLELNEDQLFILSDAYAASPRPGTAAKQRLAEETELPAETIERWFEHMRCKKREKVLPGYFMRKRNEVQAETNPVVQFLKHSTLIVRPKANEDRESYYVPESDFNEAFLRFCRKRGGTLAADMRKRNISPHTWRVALKRAGCRYDPDTESATSGDGFALKTKNRPYPRNQKLAPGAQPKTKDTVYVVGLDIDFNADV
ncbi:hypothetical protein [Medusavirus stheno T3]|uniref:DNA primase n=1 Tax=Medusavirus stheno T3 TaxID=3069717 RepID=A0A7S7YG47_9VIRU|nr:hypothetical protein QKU73_gp215 [Acanthamoeba castellanii medusavirus]QPB44560.1 hypothetical protein [Medusavirus stheno T3]